MVQITSSLIVAFILVAPSLAIPVAVKPKVDARPQGFASKLLKIRPGASICRGCGWKRPFPSVATKLAIREDTSDLEELAAREPGIKSIFNKIKNFVTKKNVHIAENKVDNVIHRVGKVADLVLPRENAEDLSEREFEDADELLERGFDDEEDLFDRDLANVDFEELEARYPSFGSIFRKIKKIASPKNLGTIAKVASFVVREEDLLSERDFAQLQELAERDPSFGSWFRKVTHSIGKVVNPANIGKVAKIASYVIREDSDEVLERDFSDFEIDELD